MFWHASDSVIAKPIVARDSRCSLFNSMLAARSWMRSTTPWTSSLLVTGVTSSSTSLSPADRGRGTCPRTSNNSSA